MQVYLILLTNFLIVHP